ncbi:MAG: hypothetical protein PHX80_04395 [Candidatus Nanoarchaeia archaeon]|nr:hypothetical protein [Candidatus Nanoarchaeia archaeon]MDD5551255.1 hypothetical protein [Candidatus Omnitrophota bacterium]
MILKIIARFISLGKVMELLAWKIHEIHNLRESHITDCPVCYHYFALDEELKKLKNNSTIYPSGCRQEFEVIKAPLNLGTVNDTVDKTHNNGHIENCQSMSFGQAFEKLMQGKKIGRNGLGWYLYLDEQFQNPIRMYIPGMLESQGIKGDFDIAIDISQEDMLLNDWIVLES